MVLLFVIAALLVVTAYVCLYRHAFQKLVNTPVCNPIPTAQQQSRVVIVGAGASGIAAAKTFVQYGYADVVLLERGDEPGGVWNSRQYAGAGLQQVYWLYAYPDFPWPADLAAAGGASPGRAAVQEYLRRYAARHGVLEKIRYGCEVKTAIRDEENGTWAVDTVQYGVLTADILIMAVGNNDSSNPILPTLPDAALFRGKILHSSEVGDGAALREANKIVVVGGSKSAFDMGQFQPDKTTLVMRTPHYWFPRWGLHAPFFDRLACYLFRGYRVDRRQRSWLVRFLDEVVLPLCAVGVHTPTESRSVLEDIMTGGGIHVCTTRDEYRSAKKWRVVRSSPAAYTADGLKLASGEIIDADVVVWGTGFEPTAFFRKVFPGVDLQDTLDDGLYLYKYMVHPALPQCYFVGFKDPSLMTLCNASLQSLWAVHCAAGLVSVPEPARLRALLDARRSDTRRRFPFSHRRAFYDYFLRPPRCDLAYGSELVRDCGLERRLASWWCHPANVWTASVEFRAVLAAPVPPPDVPRAGSESSALV